jgi:hypothetical protein
MGLNITENIGCEVTMRGTIFGDVTSCILVFQGSNVLPESVGSNS